LVIANASFMLIEKSHIRRSSFTSLLVGRFGEGRRKPDGYLLFAREDEEAYSRYLMESHTRLRVARGRHEPIEIARIYNAATKNGL